MPGGVVETDPEKLAQWCDRFHEGAKRLYEKEGPYKGDMWLFELYHHLTDCGNALRKGAGPLAEEGFVDALRREVRATALRVVEAGLSL